MASKGQMTGMLGVYLTAAELTSQGFIVAVTSRSAEGADLLVTDQQCKNAWSVQVKTNRNKASFWLLNSHSKERYSANHIYVFVNLCGKLRPEYIVERSEYVATKIYDEVSSTGSRWYSFSTGSRSSLSEDWSAFGDPHMTITDHVNAENADSLWE